MNKNKIEFDGRFWLRYNGKNFAGQGRVDLLKKIKETGSISSAAKEMNMSYKAAWDNVNTMNTLAKKPLVYKYTGGKNGGGTVITNAGEEFIKAYDKYNSSFYKILEFMENNQEVNFMLNRLDFKTSADNIFTGKINSINEGAVSTIVKILIDNNKEIVANVTYDTINRMKLETGLEVTILINASNLILFQDQKIITSGENQFKGIVKTVKKGAVNSEIFIDIGASKLLRTIVTNNSVDSLGLFYGIKIIAVCKASDIILVL